MNDIDVKDKAVFILGFLGVFLTLTTFRDQLSHIFIPIGSSQTILTVWDLTVFLISLMIVSGYLYALSYVRYSFGKFQSNPVIKWIFKIIILFANFFYSVALIYPLFIIFGSLIISSPLGSLMKEYQTTVIIFDIIGCLLLIPAGINAWFLSKKKREASN